MAKRDMEQVEEFTRLQVKKNGRVSPGLIQYADDVLLSEIMASLSQFMDLIDQKDYS